MREALLFLISVFCTFFSSLEANKTIGIFTFTQAEVNTWDPSSIHSGLAGSEEAVVYMSEQLVKLGYQVIVFGNPPPNSPYSLSNANPRYTSWNTNLPAKLDIGIVWRVAQAGENLKKFANTLYLWPHDIVNQMILTEEQINVFDDVLWLSEWQRKSWSDKYPTFAKFTHIFGNGIEPGQFNPIHIKENPYSCIYASNYGRGLDKLLAIWPQIKAKFPKATLDLYYGWKNWGLLSKAKENEMRNEVKKLETLGVRDHGMVGHEELAKAFEKTSFWTYPCTFPETFCITALKAQLAGTIPIICKHTGLLETCRSGFSCTNTQEYLPLILQAMEQAENISLATRRKIGEFVLKEFTWEKIANKWKELFEKSSKQKI
jgi:glycosyltransferase involved in cell wall biosynthesis